MAVNRLNGLSFRAGKIWCSFLLCLAMLLMSLRPIVLASIFDMPNFAKYGSGLLISSSFCMLGCFGVQTLLQRQMPMDIVNRKEGKSQIMLLQAVIIALVLCLVISIFLGLFVLVFSSFILILGVFHGLSQQLFLLATIESRSRGDYTRFGRQNFYRALFIFIAVIFVGYITKSAMNVLLAEAILSIIFSWKIIYGYIAENKFQALKLILMKALQNLFYLPWASALILMLTTIISFLLINCDRWFALGFLTTDSFACYAFIWILLSAAQSAQTIINSIFFPLLSRQYAKNGQLATFKYVAYFGLIILVICLLFSSPAFFLAKYFISSLFPEYVSVIRILPVFIIIGLLRVSDFWTSYLIIIGREKVLLMVSILSFAIVLIVWALLYDTNVNLESIALFAFMLALVKYFLVVLISIKFKEDKRCVI